MKRNAYLRFILFYLPFLFANCKENKATAKNQKDLTILLSNIEQKSDIEKNILYLSEAQKKRETVIKTYTKSRADSIDQEINALEEKKWRELSNKKADIVIDVVGKLDPNSTNSDVQNILKILAIQDSIDKKYLKTFKELENKRKWILLEGKKMIENDDLINRITNEIIKKNELRRQVDSILQMELSVGFQ